MSNQPVSKSKAKRLKIKNDLKLQRQKRHLKIMWAILIPVVILSMVVFSILYLKGQKIDYSKFLQEDGTISGINIDDYVTNNYKQMTISNKDVEPAKELINNDINVILKEHASLVTDSSLRVKRGETVNICYDIKDGDEVIASVDETTNGADILLDYDDSRPKEFYDAIIGNKPGTKISVDITYPDSYESEDLKGKTVTYAITINGVYSFPEFDDEFVSEYLSDEATTAAGYKKLIHDKYYDENLRNVIETSLSANCIVNECPDKYVSKMEKVFDRQYENYSDESGLTKPELLGLGSDEEYEAFIHDSAYSYTKGLLMYQAIFEDAGLSNDTATAKKRLLGKGYSEDDYKKAVDIYGEKYINSLVIEDIVLDYLMETVHISE